MDHRYIDENLVAQRYVDNALTPEERTEFEAHLVDCQECTDRLLLAGMFRKPSAPPPRLPLRARFVARLKPWQLLVIFAIAALILLGIPALLIPLWQLRRR
ncbi:MAG TPA: zf-HC2 domain-containing protein [Bryobacteraceae bacterium]|nr:zf-HC2 domain-containing protein [Bryobacteraceae bacterium]